MRFPFVWVLLLLLVSAAPTPAGAQDVAVRQHTVQPGETLRSIADLYGVSPETVLGANQIPDPDLLSIGQQLLIPTVDGVLHTVSAGETLHGIAETYGIDTSDLVSANGLSDSPDQITIGQVLIVPGGTAPAQQAATNSAPAPTATRTPSPTPIPTPTPSLTVVSALVSGYAPGAGAVSTRTASGTTAHWGTIAADTRLFPFGTRVRIEGLPDTVFVVEDTGSAVHGNVFDVWFPDAESARAIGARTRQITILGP